MISRRWNRCLRTIAIFHFCSTNGAREDSKYVFSNKLNDTTPIIIINASEQWNVLNIIPTTLHDDSPSMLSIAHCHFSSNHIRLHDFQSLEILLYIYFYLLKYHNISKYFDIWYLLKNVPWHWQTMRSSFSYTNCLYFTVNC